MVLLSAKAVPTVTLRHKRKKHYIKVNQSDWSQDLGRYKYSGFERVGEQHRNAELPSNIQATKKLLESESMENEEMPAEWKKELREPAKKMAEAIDEDIYHRVTRRRRKNT